MPLVTDWIMVGITFVYVIATIAICVFNGKAAKATKEQVEESKKQFEESKRLELMPFLQVEIPTESETPGFVIELPCTESDETQNIYTIVRVKNVGNGSATNITYSWYASGKKASAYDYPPINAIMSGDVYTFQFTLEADENVADGTVGSLVWQYDDLLGRSYEQRVNLVVEEGELIRCENDVPSYLGIVTYQKAKE